MSYNRLTFPLDFRWFPFSRFDGKPRPETIGSQTETNGKQTGNLILFL